MPAATLPGRRDLLTFPRSRRFTRSDSAAPASAEWTSAGQWIRVYRGAMACRFEVTLSGEDVRHIAAARDALAEADRLEAALTVFRDSSDLVQVNRTAAAAPAPVTPELFDLLARCRTLHMETGGAFDITSTPLSRCWGFLARDGRLPEPDALAAAGACVGMRHVVLEARETEAEADADARAGAAVSAAAAEHAPPPDATRASRLDARGAVQVLSRESAGTAASAAPASVDTGSRTVRFARDGVELNLGSIGKGYAVQRIADRLRAAGVRHALVSAGGSSIRALGGRDDGWPIHLRGAAPSSPLASVWLRDAALATSGAGEQFVIAGGRRYGHVLDPRTGWPAASGLVSASVITHDAADADALATAFFVGGLALARAYCGAHPGTLAILTEEADPDRPHLIGSHDGARVDIARRPTPRVSPSARAGQHASRQEAP